MRKFIAVSRDGKWIIAGPTNESIARVSGSSKQYIIKEVETVSDIDECINRIKPDVIYIDRMYELTSINIYSVMRNKNNKIRFIDINESNSDDDFSVGVLATIDGQEIRSYKQILSMRQAEYMYRSIEAIEECGNEAIIDAVSDLIRKVQLVYWNFDVAFVTRASFNLDSRLVMSSHWELGSVDCDGVKKKEPKNIKNIDATVSKLDKHGIDGVNQIIELANRLRDNMAITDIRNRLHVQGGKRIFEECSKITISYRICNGHTDDEQYIKDLLEEYI